MPNKVLSLFLVVEALFVATGGLIGGIVLVTKEHGHHPRTTADVASTLLLMQTPLAGKYFLWICGNIKLHGLTVSFLPAAIFNAGLIFFTFFVSLPGLVLPLPSSRIWLKLHAGLVVACAIVTLLLGLRIWFLTLQARSNLALLWASQSRENQSILQQKVPTPLSLSLSFIVYFTYCAGRDLCTKLNACSSGAVAISTTSPSKKTALAQILLQRAESRLVWVLLPLLPITFSISSSHPCSASWVRTTSSCWH